MSYLSELHPEVYLATPRPGGLAKMPSSTSPSPTDHRMSTVSASQQISSRRESEPGKGSMRSFGKSSMRSSFGGRSTRSYADSMMGASMRGSLAPTNFDDSFLSSTQDPSREYRIKKVLFSSTWNMLDGDEEGPNSVPAPNPVNPAITILSIVISTVMLMAVDYKKIPNDHLRWTLSYLECVKDEYGNYPPNVRRLMNHMKTIDSTLESFLLEDKIIEEEGGVMDAALGTEGAKAETRGETQQEQPGEMEQPEVQEQPEA